jgi:hypothetical protein
MHNGLASTERALKLKVKSELADEYYLINKKYEWLLSVNYHDSLTGTGEFIISQLKAVAQRSPELLISAYPA